MTTSATNPTLAAGAVKELFALSDEQILGIVPESTGGVDSQSSAPHEAGRPVAPASLPASEREASATEAAATQPNASRPSSSNQAAQPSQGTSSIDTAEPPPWLAAHMKDPWGGEEAREFWNGVQQARTETAAYRAAFATPEEARAVKELYPGGASEARSAAERSRMLEEI